MHTTRASAHHLCVNLLNLSSIGSVLADGLWSAAAAASTHTALLVQHWHCVLLDSWNCGLAAALAFRPQVQGCKVDLVRLGKAYCLKKKLCQKHLKADSIQRRNVEGSWRFCQQW